MQKRFSNGPLGGTANHRRPCRGAIGGEPSEPSELLNLRPVTHFGAVGGTVRTVRTLEIDDAHTLWSCGWNHRNRQRIVSGQKLKKTVEDSTFWQPSEPSASVAKTSQLSVEPSELFVEPSAPEFKLCSPRRYIIGTLPTDLSEEGGLVHQSAAQGQPG